MDCDKCVHKRWNFYQGMKIFPRECFKSAQGEEWIVGRLMVAFRLRYQWFMRFLAWWFGGCLEEVQTICRAKCPKMGVNRERLKRRKKKESEKKWERKFPPDPLYRERKKRERNKEGRKTRQATNPTRACAYERTFASLFCVFDAWWAEVNDRLAEDLAVWLRGWWLGIRDGGRWRLDLLAKWRNFKLCLKRV